VRHCDRIEIVDTNDLKKNPINAKQKIGWKKYSSISCFVVYTIQRKESNIIDKRKIRQGDQLMEAEMFTVKILNIENKYTKAYLQLFLLFYLLE